MLSTVKGLNGWKMGFCQPLSEAPLKVAGWYGQILGLVHLHRLSFLVIIRTRGWMLWLRTVVELLSLGGKQEFRPYRRAVPILVILTKSACHLSLVARLSPRKTGELLVCLRKQTK